MKMFHMMALPLIAASALALAAAAPLRIGITPPTTYVDGTPITVPLDFDLYGGKCSDPRPFPHLDGPTRALIFPAPRNPAPGQKHCYYGTATDTVSKLQSDPSPELVIDLTAATPPPPPPPSKPLPPSVKPAP